MDSAEIYRAVNERYSAISKGTGHEQYASTIAASFGYTDEDLAGIPKDANLGLSCGNPLVIAGLKEASTTHPVNVAESLTLASRAKSSSTWAVAPVSTSSRSRRRSAPQAEPSVST